MPIVAESQDTIFGDILFELGNNTNLRRTSPGSKTRALVDAVSKKMGTMYTKFDVNLVQAFVDGAVGQYLDLIGNLLNVPRLSPVTALAPAIERNVRFYVNTGTFGSINNGNSISIPAGTIISTGPSSTGIQYKVPFTTILLSSASQLYIEVESLRTGVSSNIGARQLINHNFTNYAQVLNNTLKVVNDAEITRGQDIESDTNYRFRITNQTLVAEKANATAIRIAALIVPGVADATIIPFFSGIGTFDVLIRSVSPTLSAGLLAAVRNSISIVSAQGIVANIRGPKEIGISIIGNLLLRNRVTPAEESSLISAVQSNISTYIDNLDIGEDLIIEQLVQRVLATSDVIKSVGTTAKPFEVVYIYKPTKLETSKVRSTLIDNYTALTDERLIVENVYAGSTPIFFRVVYQ